MSASEYHVGQRLSLKNQTCTVRYVGPVADKQGEWLGVEWDDVSRGKHDGMHGNLKYFECRSSSPTAGSFLRPKQAWDEPRSFLQALQNKYIVPENSANGEVLYVSGKQAEEVGFDKFAKRQAELRGIHVLVLDHMRIRHRTIDERDAEDIAEICANITDLDLSSNLFQTIDEITTLCGYLPKLQNLVLDGNRFSTSEPVGVTTALLPAVRTLRLSTTLLPFDALLAVLERFSGIEELILAENELNRLSQLSPMSLLQTIDLSGNKFTTLSALSEIRHLRHLRCVSLKHNSVSDVGDKQVGADVLTFQASLDQLDLSHGAITSWDIFNDLPICFPGLKHLRVTGNPLYQNLTSADGKLLTSEDGYMLTIARLPQLETLNYSKIQDKERLNAETYYLSQITIEVSNASAESEVEVLSRHPRWNALCEEYGEPTITRKPKADEIDPNSLAAKLITFDVYLSDTTLSHINKRSWAEELPKSVNTYSLHGIIGKRLSIMPLKLRLIWETGERDPIGRDDGYSGPEWWDSSDDEDGVMVSEHDWVAREVELTAGTRAVGTYVEGRQATVRIELKDALPL